MHKLVCWLRSNELSINESKTEVLLFRSASAKVPNDFFIEINDWKVFPSKFVKYVGVFIDENLNWNCHFTSLCIKLSQSVGIISKLRHYTSTDICVSVYYSLFQSYLLYGCLSWQFANETLLNKIKVLQRKAIRFLTFSNRDDSTSPLFLHLNILKVEDSFSSCVLSFMYELYSKNLPISMYKFFVYNNRNSLRLLLPYVKSKKFGERSLRFNGAKVWNKTTENLNIKVFCSIIGFKKFLKKRYIESYK